MTTNTKRLRRSLFLFALITIGAKDCDPWMIGDPVPVSSGAVMTSGGDMCGPSNGRAGAGGGGGGAGLGGADVGSSGMGGSGVGSADTSVGAGGGEPGEQPQTCGDDEPLGTWIHCKGLDAVQCMEKCAEAGAACAPRMRHPQKADVGWGDLYYCKTGLPTYVCSHYYSNGDECLYSSPIGSIPWCAYIGGKP